MNEIKYENKEKKYYVKNTSNKKKIKNYISIILIVLILLGGVLMLSSISKIDSIGNNEIGSVDYTVYLKDNNFYTNKFLKKGDSQANNYIASLINTINVSFIYDNNYSNVIDYEYDYRVDCKIIVTEKNDSSKILYSKEEVLLDTTKEVGKDSRFSINKDFDIDYEKYNAYVNNFKETYGLDVDSNLVITMNISHKGAYGDKQIANKTSTLTISIPLTKNTIDISINTNQLANSFNIPIDESMIDNKYIFVIGIIISSLSFVSLVVIFLLGRKKDDIYRKEIDRILKNYDRLIITSSQPSIDETNYKNKVRVMSIEELIDVNELTNEPIIYYEVQPDEKSYFVILKQDTLYKLTISKAYLEKHKNDAKEVKKVEKETE